MLGKGFFTFLGLLLVAGPVGAVIDPNDLPYDSAAQKCLNEINKNVAKVAKAQGLAILKCLKDGSKNNLSDPTIEQCTTADNDQKVAKATSKLDSKVSDRCAGTAISVDQSTIDDLNQRAIDKELALYHGWFGADLDAAIETQQGTDQQKATAKCQLVVAKQGQKCQDTKLKQYNKCKKDGMKAEPPFDDPNDFAACHDVDPGGKRLSGQ
jgi:hypothetical protein